MKKIFEEYGGVITVAMAIVALVCVVALLLGGPNGGWIGNAFHGITDKFLDKTSTAMDAVSVDGAVSGSGNGGADAEEETLAPGLYDANDALLASWDSLVNDYGLDVSKSYSTNGGDSNFFMNSTTSPYSVFTNYAELSAGVRLIIPDGVTTIGDAAFCNCLSLASITIPDNVTSIGASAFYRCTALTSITIPDSVTDIGDYAFYQCGSLTNAEIGDSVTSINWQTFYGCVGLKSVKIGDSVTTIGSEAFRECESLTSVTFGENGQLTTIGNYAFYGCTDLVSITIPDGVTTIDASAFRYCTALTSITIPDSVTSLSTAFQECSSLANITFKGTVAQWNAIDKSSYWNAECPVNEVVCSDGTMAL